MARKHMLLMVACCAIPLAAVAAITLFNVPVNSVLTLGIVLLCPLLHLVMMRGMIGHRHPNADHKHPGHDAKRTPMAQPAQLIPSEGEEAFR